MRCFQHSNEHSTLVGRELFGMNVEKALRRRFNPESIIAEGNCIQIQSEDRMFTVDIFEPRSYGHLTYFIDDHGEQQVSLSGIKVFCKLLRNCAAAAGRL